MSTLRSYDDPCGIARALDRLGERWALLIVRELLFGPKRFTDLRAGVPGASPNVLSQRLRDMEAAGVLSRRVLPAPSKSVVYELTAWGRELEPVLLALGRWGGRARPVEGSELSADALMLALRSTFSPGAAGGRSARLDLRVGEDQFRVRVDRRGYQVVRGSHDRPDAIIATDVATLRKMTLGPRGRSGSRGQNAHVEGDKDVAAWFFGLFSPPVPVVPPLEG